MAGSLSYIVGRDGCFTMDLIENLGDAYDALEQCYLLIIELSGGDMERISAACNQFGFPDPWAKERYDDDPMPAVMRIP